ncbi:unnamed protein product, partial [Ectocarpus sp. 12 AP-2014]
AAGAAATAAPVEEADEPRYSDSAPYPSPPAAPEVNLAAALPLSVENGAGGGSAGGATGQALMSPTLPAGTGSTTLVSLAAGVGNDASVTQAAPAVAPLPGARQPVPMAGVATATQAALPLAGTPYALPLYGAAPTGQAVASYGATPVSGVPQAALWPQQTVLPLPGHHRRSRWRRSRRQRQRWRRRTSCPRSSSTNPPRSYRPPCSTTPLRSSSSNSSSSSSSNSSSSSSSSRREQGSPAGP